MEILYLHHLFLTFTKCANPETGGKYLRFKFKVLAAVAQAAQIAAYLIKRFNSLST